MGDALLGTAHFEEAQGDLCMDVGVVLPLPCDEAEGFQCLRVTSCGEESATEGKASLVGKR